VPPISITAVVTCRTRACVLTGWSVAAAVSWWHCASLLQLEAGNCAFISSASFCVGHTLSVHSTAWHAVMTQSLLCQSSLQSSPATPQGLAAVAYINNA
jgi:hypothetical protein